MALGVALMALGVAGVQVCRRGRHMELELDVGGRECVRDRDRS